MSDSEVLKKLLAEAHASLRQLEDFNFGDEDLCTDVIIHVDPAVVHLRDAASYVPNDTPFRVYLYNASVVRLWATFAKRSDAQRAAEALGGPIYGFPKGKSLGDLHVPLDESVTFYIDDLYGDKGRDS